MNQPVEKIKDKEESKRTLKLYRDELHLANFSVYIPGEILRVELEDDSDGDTITDSFLFETNIGEFSSSFSAVGCDSKRIVDKNSASIIMPIDSDKTVIIQAGWAATHGTVRLYTISYSNF